jgi:carbamoyl-phosphate synthase large subunit
VTSERRTVLLTGAGGVAIPGLIEVLRSAGFRVLAADMDKKAIGLLLADRGFVIPPGTSQNFVQKLGELCSRESVDAIIPLVDEELRPAFALEERGIAIILPEPAFVDTCLDKYVLMERLRSAGIRVPKTELANVNVNQVNFPAIVKPRTGRGSRGVKVIHDPESLQAHLAETTYSDSELLIQEYVVGTEYTVSVVCWRDGVIQAVVPKEVLSKKGVTQLAVTRRNEQIEGLCQKIQDSLRPSGPFNLQLILERSTEQPVPFEINPRFSTTLSLTIAAGVNEVVELLDRALCDSPPRLLDWEEGVVLVRQTLDVFHSEDDFVSRQSNVISVAE